MTMLAEILIALLLVMGGCFGLIGSYGLLRLKQPMQRLHAPTKAVTMGVATALIASAAQLYLTTGHLPWHNLMIALFLFLAAPLSALYLAKTHLHSTVDPADLPPPAKGGHWAGRKAG